jgi:hypothetical protein
MSNGHSDQPRHRQATRLLAHAMPVAAFVVTLAAGPLATATPVATPSGTSRASAVLADDDDHCNAAILSGAVNPMKYPLCAGD